MGAVFFIVENHEFSARLVELLATRWRFKEMGQLFEFWIFSYYIFGISQKTTLRKSKNSIYMYFLIILRNIFIRIKITVYILRFKILICCFIKRINTWYTGSFTVTVRILLCFCEYVIKMYFIFNRNRMLFVCFGKI